MVRVHAGQLSQFEKVLTESDAASPGSWQKRPQRPERHGPLWIQQGFHRFLDLLVLAGGNGLVIVRHLDVRRDVGVLHVIALLVEKPDFRNAEIQRRVHLGLPTTRPSRCRASACR